MEHSTSRTVLLSSLPSPVKTEPSTKGSSSLLNSLSLLVSTLSSGVNSVGIFVSLVASHLMYPPTSTCFCLLPRSSRSCNLGLAWKQFLASCWSIPCRKADGCTRRFLTFLWHKLMESCMGHKVNNQQFQLLIRCWSTARSTSSSSNVRITTPTSKKPYKVHAIIHEMVTMWIATIIQVPE